MLDFLDGFRAGYSCETQLLTTMHDLLRNNDKGLQTDMVILDFSKAFDTVPHGKLLHKLEKYGINGNIHSWLEVFLTKRHMLVVMDGDFSDSVTVDSGVPQGTVLGPLFFLYHINNLPDCVNSQVRLFTDDCLLYRTINTQSDHLTFQKDLEALEKWASDWGMRLNAKKCYLMSFNSRSSHDFYTLNNHILQKVKQNPYLGILISEDLKWEPHLIKITKKAKSTLAFLKRNLRHCPELCRRTAYISLVRSVLEYGSIVWDPYYVKDINRIEKIQAVHL